MCRVRTKLMQKTSTYEAQIIVEHCATVLAWGMNCERAQKWARRVASLARLATFFHGAIGDLDACTRAHENVAFLSERARRSRKSSRDPTEPRIEIATIAHESADERERRSSKLAP